jgi:hypothetical protein
MPTYSPDLYLKRNSEDDYQLCISFVIPIGFELAEMKLSSTTTNGSAPNSRNITLALLRNAEQTAEAPLTLEVPIPADWQSSRNEVQLSVIERKAEADRILHEMRTPLRTLREVRPSSWLPWRNRKTPEAYRSISRHPRPIYSDDDR